MDIEQFIGIEQSLNNYLISDITKIIINYLGLNFEKIINNHIKAQNRLINIRGLIKIISPARGGVTFLKMT